MYEYQIYIPSTITHERHRRFNIVKCVFPNKSSSKEEALRKGEEKKAELVSIFKTLGDYREKDSRLIEVRVVEC